MKTVKRDDSDVPAARNPDASESLTLSMTSVDRRQRAHLALNESAHQQLTRNLGELLQEVRVLQTGAQLLLGFLLALAFTPRFGQVTTAQRDIYVVSLLLGFASSALLMAPAPFHRVVFRSGLRHRLVATSNRLALVGTVLLMLAMTSALLLILDVLLGRGPAMWISAGTSLWFGLWWYAVPMWHRHRHCTVAQIDPTQDQTTKPDLADRLDTTYTPRRDIDSADAGVAGEHRIPPAERLVESIPNKARLSA